jgi:hypothetical protein
VLMAYEARTWENGKGLAINAANLNTIEAGIASCSQDIEVLSELMEPKTIWENEEPTEIFAAQEHERDLSKYKRFSVLFEDKKDSSQYVEYQVSQKDIDMYFGVNRTHSSSYEYGRIIKFTNDKITFSNVLRNGSEYSSYNNFSIPVKIIGYKY